MRRLAIAQVALTTLTLVAAALLLESFRRVESHDLGFQKNGVLTFELTPSTSRFSADTRLGYYTTVVERLQQLPNVSSVGAIRLRPLKAGAVPSFNAVRREHATDSDKERVDVEVYATTAGYFRTMGVRVIEGRAFRGSENYPVMVVSRTWSVSIE